MGNRVLKVGGGKLDPTAAGTDPIVFHCNEHIAATGCAPCQEDLNVRGYYYAREAGGKVLATYETSPEGLTGQGSSCYAAYYYQDLKEWYIYGSESDGRISVLKPYVNEFTDHLHKNAIHLFNQAEPYAMKDTIIEYQANTIGTFSSNARITGHKEYEILVLSVAEVKDHLGNVRAVISDVKNPENITSSISSWTFTAEIRNLSNYYPYGLQMPSGMYNQIEDYSYGYNGMEKDDELKGGGKTYTTLFRQASTVEGTWWSRDPMEFTMPYQSPYLLMDNNPVSVTDIRGLFGSRDEAKAYRSENNLKGRIFENVGGEFSIDDNEAGTSIWNQPGLGIQKGILMEEELVEGKISNLPNDIKYVYDPLPSIERNRELSEDVPAIILHRTVSSNGVSQFKRWVESNKVAGTHFLVGEDGMIFQTGNLKKQTIHLFDSPKQMYAEYFGKFNNTNTIGIEVIGNYNAKTKTWDPLTSDQCKATAMLVLELTYRYNLEIKDLFPHEKVQRKTKGEGQVVLDAIMEELLNGW